MEFDNLLQQACSIKSYQLNQDKKKFENSPEFIKSTLYCADFVKNVRNQIFPLKKMAFEAFRISGIKLINLNLFDEAQYRFEKALSIFKYIVSRLPNWKTEGIKDEDLTYHEDKGKNPLEQAEISRLIISALLNISLCYLKTDKYVDLRQICDEIISRDKNNVKAYYRRAKSYLNCPSSSLEDHEIGILDLKKCLELEDNKEIHNEYLKVKSYIESQKVQEKKVFKNIFRKANESLLREEIKSEIKEEVIPEGRNEVKMINLLVDQSIALMNQYDNEGRVEDAEKMREVVEKSQQYKENLERILRINLDSPNEELYKFAKDHNLDLKDPNVRKYFTEIKQGYLDKINNFYKDSIFNPNALKEMENERILQESKSVRKNQQNSNFNTSNQKKEVLNNSNNSKPKNNESASSTNKKSEPEKKTIKYNLSDLTSKKSRRPLTQEEIIQIFSVTLIILILIFLGYFFYYKKPINHHRFYNDEN